MNSKKSLSSLIVSVPGKCGIFFLLLSVPLCLAAKPNYDFYGYPYYEEVVGYFFKNCSPKLPEGTATVIDFQKKKDGWHVVYHEYFPDKIFLLDDLLWSSTERKFQRLQHLKQISSYTTDADEKEILSANDGQWFNMFPFYNYSGWEWDVIHELENKPLLPDTPLYALARAYSSFASNLLHNDSGIDDTVHSFHFTNGNWQLTDEQLAEYRHYHELGIAAFRRLAIQNPAFETIVGNIAIKLDDEYLVSYIELYAFKNREEALKELPDGLYNPFYLDFGKNILTSCPRNALLITYGDIDTYAPLYVQEKLGYRTDVTIINNSLLGVDWYIDLVRRNDFHPQQVAMKFPSEKYRGNLNDYVYISKNDSTPISVGDVLQYASDNSLAHAEDKEIPGKNFVLTGPDNSENKADTVQWIFYQRYILKNELMKLDIINENHWQKPVCFTTTCGADAYFVLSNYLREYGLVYELTPKVQSQIATSVFLDTAKERSLLMDSFSYHPVPFRSAGAYAIAGNYSIYFSELANAIDSANEELAMRVIEKYFSVFPGSEYPLCESHVGFVTAYLKMKRIENAVQLASGILLNFETGINRRSYENQSAFESRFNNAAKSLYQVGLTYSNAEIINLAKKDMRK